MEKSSKDEIHKKNGERKSVTRERERRMVHYNENAIDRKRLLEWKILQIVRKMRLMIFFIVHVMEWNFFV